MGMQHSGVQYTFNMSASYRDGQANGPPAQSSALHRQRPDKVFNYNKGNLSCRWPQAGSAMLKSVVIGLFFGVKICCVVGGKRQLQCNGRSNVFNYFNGLGMGFFRAFGFAGFTEFLFQKTFALTLQYRLVFVFAKLRGDVAPVCIKKRVNSHRVTCLYGQQKEQYDTTQLLHYRCKANQHILSGCDFCQYESSLLLCTE